MRRAILRADGSFRFGLGHIVRCLAVAEGLDEAGVEPVFITQAIEPRVTALMRAQGVLVEELPPGVPMDEDARLTRRIASHHEAELIVTDLCHAAALEAPAALAAYHEVVREGHCVVALENAEWMELPADLVVYPYVKAAYPSSPAGDGEGQWLLGPSYAIFRREFIQAARLPRVIAEQARRILVVISGSDPLRLTAKVVRALRGLRGHQLELRVMLGAATEASLRHEVAELLTGFAGMAEIMDDTTHLADAMRWSDLAITGDGLTKYETAVTGTPSLFIERPDGPQQLNEEFAHAGTAVRVGDGSRVTEARLAELVASVLDDQPRRSAMSARGKALVDGRGLERVIARIPTGVLR